MLQLALSSWRRDSDLLKHLDVRVQKYQLVPDILHRPGSLLPRGNTATVWVQGQRVLETLLLACDVTAPQRDLRFRP